MRTWARIPDRASCGGCGQELKQGSPVQLITPDPSRPISKPKVRCVFCAEGTPPADLPPLVAKSVSTKPMVHIPSGAGTLPLDFKRASVADLQALLPRREPGQEG